MTARRSLQRVRGFTERAAEGSEASELALGAARTKNCHLRWIVVLGIVDEIGAPTTTAADLAPALDAAKGHLPDLTPSVSAAAERSAIRASPPFIASAAAMPIIEVSVM